MWWGIALADERIEFPALKQTIKSAHATVRRQWRSVDDGRGRLIWASLPTETEVLFVSKGKIHGAAIFLILSNPREEEPKWCHRESHTAPSWTTCPHRNAAPHCNNLCENWGWIVIEAREYCTDYNSQCDHMEACLLIYIYHVHTRPLYFFSAL